MDKVKDQIKILERMLSNMEVRNFPDKEKDELASVLEELLKQLNEGVYKWFVEQEKKKEKEG